MGTKELNLYMGDKLLGDAQIGTIDIDTVFINELRKKYEGLNLSDDQMLQVANMGLTREQVIQIMELCKKVVAGIEEVWNSIISILQSYVNSDEWQKLIKEIEKQDDGTQIKRNRKGKQLKPWEKKNFYE